MTAALFIQAGYLLAFAVGCSCLFIGFVAGALAVWSRLHRLARVSYAAGRLDERQWREQVTATYESGPTLYEGRALRLVSNRKGDA